MLAIESVASSDNPPIQRRFRGAILPLRDGLHENSLPLSQAIQLTRTTFRRDRGYVSSGTAHRKVLRTNGETFLWSSAFGTVPDTFCNDIPLGKRIFDVSLQKTNIGID